MQKLRGVAGALERQLAAGRAQLNELQSARAAWDKTQERYKAEFIVLQRKWVEREKEIRAESDMRAQQMLEAEKAKVRMLAQDEINQRASRLAEQMQKDKAIEVARAEMSIRAELERGAAERISALQADWDKARKQLEGELERLHQELVKKGIEAHKAAAEISALAQGQDERERLCTAQATQVRNLQEALEQARGELAREVHLARLHSKQKEKGEGDPSA